MLMGVFFNLLFLAIWDSKINYNNVNNWKKCIGLLNFRKKIKKNNYYINKGLKGDTYEFAMKLDKLLSFRSTDFSVKLERSNELMW